MFKKKNLIILLIVIFTGCEYKPIYSNVNRSIYNIIITEFTGDKNLNKFLMQNIERNSQKDSSEIVNLKINTIYTKNILAKNTTGTITDYQIKAVTTFIIEQRKEEKTFTVDEKFNYQKMSDKYEERNYEQNIKKNLAKSISQKLILRLSIPQ